MKRKTIAGLIAIIAIGAISIAIGLFAASIPNTASVTISYSGHWTGTYGDAGSIKSVDGMGHKAFVIDNPQYVVSTTFQKQDASHEKMTIEIYVDGKRVKSESTTAAYGVVSITHTL